MNPNEFGMGAWVPASYGHCPKEAQVKDDEWWMMVALQEAQTFTGGASPNPTVGCVIVKDESIIARGVTETFGGRHGEKVAADSVRTESLQGSTAYVTLEPCSHQGKQAPCAPMLVKLGITRCVIGIQDPFDKVDGGGIKILQDAGVEVRLGILADACRAWHLDFLFHCAYKRPLILAKWAQSLDGQLADDDNQSKWITGAEARAYTHLLRQKCDGIMVGAGTILADKPSLDVRDCKPRIHRSPVKIIIDHKGKLLEAAQRDQEQIQAKTLGQGVTIYCGPNIQGSFLDKSTAVHHHL